jgi:phosphoglycolate phosphatase-like HAD superfamily hydrolase
MLRNIRGVIGDLGDTIISGKPMVRALQSALQDVMGLNVCEKTIYKGFGMPKHEQIKQLVEPYYPQMTDRNIHTIHVQFENRLREFYDKQGVTYLPGTEIAIKAFNKHGIRFGCTTGLSKDMIHHMYPKFPTWRPSPVVHCVRPNPGGIYEILTIWNKGVPPSKHITLEQCVKVGDSMSDFEEAQAAGIPFIGIIGHRLDGNVVGQQMYREGAHAIVNSLDDVLDEL